MERNYHMFFCMWCGGFVASASYSRKPTQAYASLRKPTQAYASLRKPTREGGPHFALKGVVVVLLPLTRLG